MKVSELEGAKLDYWVARSLDWHWVKYHNGELLGVDTWRPSIDWSQGGPIIEREGICLGFTVEQGCIRRKASYPAWMEPQCEMLDERWLVAAMRCLVASKFGETVED